VITKTFYAGFDTEYQPIEIGKNELVSCQLAVTGEVSVEIPNKGVYEIQGLQTVTQEEYLTNDKERMIKLRMD
jgi:hypothetical protein